MNRDELLRRVKDTIHEVEPGAEVILYGSRSRGDESFESDWDFLILVDGSVVDQRTDNIRHRLYEIEWELGEVLSSIIRDRTEWNSSPYRATPFHQKVDSEGILL